MAADEAPDRPPVSAGELREMKDFYRQSRNALPAQAALGVAVSAAGVAVHVWWSRLPWWAWALLVGVAWYGFVGDLINVLYLRRRLARVGGDHT